MSGKESSCQGSTFMLFLTRGSFRKIEMEQHKHFCFHAQISGNQTEFICHDFCLVGCYLNEKLEGCFQCYLDGLVDGVNENRRGLVEPNIAGYRRWSQWVRAYLNYDLPWFKWLIMVTVGNGVVSYLWGWKAETTDCCLPHSVESECISQVFEWLIMKGIDKGEPFNLLWSVGDAGMQGIDRGRDCIVLVMPWDSVESDNSREEEVSFLITTRVQTGNCHVFVFKETCNGDPKLKGTGHKSSFVPELSDENTGERESSQIQRVVVEFIRKCSPIVSIGVNTKGGVNEAVCVLMYNHIETMNFNISVTVTVQAFTLYAKVSKNDQVSCFLNESDRGELSQVFVVQSMIAKTHYPAISKSIWKAEIFGRSTKCKELHPFHYGKINCKMKFLQPSSSKNHMMLLNLPSKPMIMMLVGAREIELAMMLQWGLEVLSISKFKTAWLKIISYETEDMRARCVNAVKRVIEWMIAWRDKSVLRVRIKQELSMMIQN